MANYAAIVLSAGSGKRMHSDIPKQYLELEGKPVIYYCLKAFQDSEVSQIVLVCGAEDVEFCQKEIVEKYHLTKVCHIVPGGAERYHSVYEGLKCMEGVDYVLIHDGARPVVSQEIISRSMEGVQQYHACVAAMPVKDTIKLADASGYVDCTPPRHLLWQIQTPQTFSYSLIRDSYEKVFRDQKEGKEIPTITDDAMVAEYASGKKIKLIEGSYENIKITTPEDLSVAKLFLKKM